MAVELGQSGFFLSEEAQGARAPFHHPAPPTARLPRPCGRARAPVCRDHHAAALAPQVRSHSLRSSPTTCPEAMRQRPSGRLPRPRRCSTALRLTCTRGTASMARRGATLQERAPLQSGALAVAAQAQERPCARVSRARACQLDSCCFVLVRAPRSPLSPGRVYGLCSRRSRT